MPSLEDMIARSGPENFERMRKGFVEYPEEARARKLEEMTLQGKQMELEAYPEAQQRTREKFGMEKQEFATNQKVKELTIQRVKQQYAQADTEEKRKKLEDFYELNGNIILGMSALKTPEEQKEYFRKEKSKLLIEGDDEQDKAIEALDKLEGEEFTKAVKVGLMSNPIARKHLADLSKSKSKGGTAFERALQASLDSGVITQEQYNERMNKYSSVKSGLGTSATTDIKISESQRKERNKRTADLRDDAGKGLEHFNGIAKNVNAAIAAMDAGNNGLADTLMGSVMSQVQDTNVKAMAMYEKFDTSYGNAAERIANSVSRFLSGSRSESEKGEIRETLSNFRDSYAVPGQKKLRSQYRNLAREEKLDPFKVIPPQSPQDIKDATGIDTQEKLRLLKEYYPNAFKAGEAK